MKYPLILILFQRNLSQHPVNQSYNKNYIMSSKLQWDKIEDSDASEEEPQVEADPISDTKSQVKSEAPSESQKSSYSNNGKRPSNEVNHKYGSVAAFRQTFKSEQLELLEKIEGKLVYMFVFKVNHTLFAPTMQTLECVSKVEQERGWELRIDRAAAKKLLTEGLPNNMFAKMQLSNKNFYTKSEKYQPKPPKSETNTEDTKSNYEKEVKSMTLTDNSDIASKDFSQRSSNVSREKVKQPSTYGNKEKGKEYSKVYYTKNSYNNPRNYAQKPKYKVKEGSVCSEDLKTQEKKEDFESDEEVKAELKEKKLKIEQEVRKRQEKKKEKKYNEKKYHQKKEKVEKGVEKEKEKTATKPKNNNPFAALGD